MRSCGPCDLCCRLPLIEELKKPACVTCSHLKASSKRRCKIYDDRPQVCRDFVCSWLEGNLPDRLRPDKAHMYIYSNENDVLTLVLDPNYPDALRRPAGLDIIRYLYNQNMTKEVQVIMAR